MKKIIQLTIVMFIFNSNYGVAQLLISPFNQFDTPDSAIRFGTEIEGPRQLFILKNYPQNDNWLEFGFHQFSMGFQDNVHEIVMWSKRKMDLSTGEIVESKTESVQNSISPNGNQSYLFDMVHSASSIIIDDKQVVLENAYTPRTEIEIILGHPYILKSALERVDISPNQQWIGGMVRYSNRTVDIGLYHVSFPVLWNFSGQVLFPNPIINFEDYRAYNSFPIASEVKFSPDSNFFIARGMGAYDTISTPNGPEAQRTITFSDAFMINTETLDEWEVGADVTFTSDSNFFVTLRDGYPSLVSVNSNRVLQQYDIGDTYMLAVTFSNNDQTLYIATVEYSPTADGKVYVFPSQLPTSNAVSWEIYK